MFKLINTMEVGNMWPSMLAASRHGVVEQVASMKERSLFELINQIGAESQWNDISEKLFMLVFPPFEFFLFHFLLSLIMDVKLRLVPTWIYSVGFPDIRMLSQS